MKFSQVKRGMVLDMDGNLMQVVDMVHQKPGKGPAYYQTKLKSLEKGTVIQKRFQGTDEVEMAFLETRKMEFLYRDGEMLCFMDSGDYDQQMISAQDVGDAINYLAHNMEVKVVSHEGRVLSVELPTAVVLEVTETEPGVKGDTVSNVFKPAKLETGLEIKVPLFITEGEKVRVDTRTGEFLERAN